MSLQGNKSIDRIGETTVQGEAVSVIGLDQWGRHVVDIILATMGLVLFVPIVLLISLAGSLASGGPVFIREALPGCNTCDVAYRINPRIRRVGRILSLSGIDELPQLINVLRGEMPSCAAKCLSAVGA